MIESVMVEMCAAVGHELVDRPLDLNQVILECGRFRIDAHHFEQAVLFHLLVVHTPAGGVAEQLVAALAARR
jgi:hypothetical protein